VGFCNEEVSKMAYIRMIIGVLIAIGVLAGILAGVQAQRSETLVDTIYVPASGPKDTGSAVFWSISIFCKYRLRLC